MRIIQLTTGLIEIPPKGWGAIEYVIWNYVLELKKLGHDVDIFDYYDFTRRYNHGYRDFDFVHIHTSDQSYFMIENNIPFYLTIHDIHTYLYQKTSKEYLDSHMAINKSILTFVPSMFLIERFSQFKNKMIFINHGVNNDFFTPKEKDMSNFKLLCVSRNLTVGGVFDNKGYELADLVANEVGMSITFVGENNDFFQDCKTNILGDKINRDVHKDELIDIYGQHHILLHLSKYESGQPCLSILESLSCGLPVVATYIDDIEIPGVEFVKRNKKDIINSIKKIKNNYKHYKEQSLISAKKYSWKNVVNRLNINYYDYIKKSNKTFEKVESNNEKIIIKKEDDSIKVITKERGNHIYDIKYVDNKSKKLIYNTTIKNNMWSIAHVKDIDEVMIEIKRDDYVHPYYFLYR